METRTTLKPGDRGTRKLLERFGKRLVCVRYRYKARKPRANNPAVAQAVGGTYNFGRRWGR